MGVPIASSNSPSATNRSPDDAAPMLIPNRARPKAMPEPELAPKPSSGLGSTTSRRKCAASAQLGDAARAFIRCSLRKSPQAIARELAPLCRPAVDGSELPNCGGDSSRDLCASLTVGDGDKFGQGADSCLAAGSLGADEQLRSD